MLEQGAVYGDVENFQDAVDYFNLQLGNSNPEFWSRTGGRPDFSGRRVLEVGCGHGALSVDMAQSNATVVGVDLNKWRVDFANELVRSRFPEVAARTHFTATAVQDLPTDAPFDYVVSKDTFEHVDNLDDLLKSLYQLLKPGGFLIAGSTPLYWSPKGDHGRTGLRVPSLHAILPTSVVLSAASRRQSQIVSSLSDLGLNGYTPEQYRRIFDRSNFQQDRLAWNQGKPVSRFLNGFRAIPGLEKFVTTGFYLRFRRPLE
jgi:ubiquinone/menaquinone biosynthesis C-methylase UbiE